MKEIKATVVYPVEISIMVDESASPDEVWHSILEHADEEVKDVAPVIHTCSQPDLLLHSFQKLPLEPESQADWVQGAVQGLLRAKENIASAVIARPFLLTLKDKNGNLLVEKISKLAAMTAEVLEEIIAGISTSSK